MRYNDRMDSAERLDIEAYHGNLLHVSASKLLPGNLLCRSSLRV